MRVASLRSRSSRFRTWGRTSSIARVAWPFSHHQTGPPTPDYERVWIAFHIDPDAHYERVGFSQQNMDAFATWLPMLVADAMLCDLGDTPEDGLSLLNDISAFADGKLEQIAGAAGDHTEESTPPLATRARDWMPAEFSDNAFQVHCEVDLWEEQERIKVMTPFTPPEAATPEACRELVWITWDWVVDGSGLHLGRAAMAAQHLRMFAAVIEGAGVLPAAHDRGYAPQIVMEQAEEIASEAWGADPKGR
jgi:hypothetical protein